MNWDRDTVDFFDCNLCNRKAILPHCRERHHRQRHLMIPYQLEHYKYVETRFKRFKCKICCDIVIRSKRVEHQAKNHSQFKNDKHLFNQIWMEKDLQHDMKVLDQGEYRNQLKCYRCKIMFNQSDFAQHIQQKHPDCLTSIGQTKSVSQKQKKKTQSAKKKQIEDIKKEEKDNTGTNVNATENEVTESQTMDIEMRKEEIDPIPNEEANELKEEKDEPMKNVDGILAVTRNTTRHYRCTFCHKLGIAEKNLLKHHIEDHRNRIQFQLETYIFEYTVEKKFQCNICAIVIDKLNGEEHRQQNHPMFKKICFLFETIFITHYPKSDITKWPRNMDAIKARCKHCKIEIHRIQFLEHFENTHPEMLNWSFEESSKSQEQNIGESDENADESQVQDENQPFYTISVSHSELQRLVQQNRIYGQDGKFILKDSA